MLARDLSAYCETIGRFADIRATAKPPRDRVIVQNVGNVIKLVAGTETSTVVIDCGKSTGDDGMALVSARTLLSAAKALGKKGEVEVRGGPKGITLVTPTGGRVEMPNVDNYLPDLVRPQLVAGFVQCVTPEGFWPRTARIVKAVAGSYLDFRDVFFSGEDDCLFVQAMSPYTYADTRVNNNDWVGMEGAIGSVPADFIDAIRGLDEPGVINFDAETMMVRSGPVTAVSKYRSGSESFVEFPAFDAVEKTAVTVPRNRFKEMVSTASSSDPRIRLVASEGSLTVEEWSEDGGSIELSAKVNGEHGTVGVDGPMLRKILTALTDRDVTFRFSPKASAAVSLDSDGWRILLATVALS